MSASKFMRRGISTMAIAATGLGIVGATTAAPSGAATTGVKTRATVPWSSVGNGWLAANSVKNGVNTLLLVAPSGQAYTIAALAKGETVAAVAHDGRHVLTQRWINNTLTHRIWDTTTGRVSASLPTMYGSYAFTRPTGSAIMGQDYAHGTYARFSTSGSLQYKTNTGTQVQEILPNPNGLTDATWTVDGRVELRTHSTFALKRTFARPTTYQYCYPTGWANESTLTIRCSKSGSAQVFAQNINGGAPVAMTSGTNGLPEADGWYDAVATSIGRVGIPSRVSAPDFPREVYRFAGTKPVQRIPMPFFNPNAGQHTNDVTIDRIVGNKVVLTSSPLGEDDAMRTVGQYDLVTKKVNYLVGHNSQFGGTVGGYAMIDLRR